ncbi:N-6 DNA methylase [Alcaligenes sp. CHO6]|uniref:N-6 DNA methylase n=1 Tax=Alcaligenes sp. CHO6 TaxID=3123298 RepID=UPI0030156774
MATKAQQHKFVNTADEHQQQIIKLLREVARYRGLDQTWSDWVEMGAIAIANAVDKSQFESREKRYLDIVAQYQKEDVNLLVRAFAHLVQCWEQRVTSGEFGDVLGSTFMMMDMGNASTGQFFTPYEVSRLMAGIIMSDHAAHHQAQLQRRGFITLQEPACGAGGMVVAAIHALVDSRINYQQALHVTAIDIDRRCVHMTYLQLALLHVPAIILQGNALSLEVFETWYTPAHILGGWSSRLREQRAVGNVDQLLMPEIKHAGGESSLMEPVQHVVRAIQKGVEVGQMSLF